MIIATSPALSRAGLFLFSKSMTSIRKVWQQHFAEKLPKRKTQPAYLADCV
jgi:hypothetical protein